MSRAVKHKAQTPYRARNFEGRDLDSWQKTLKTGVNTSYLWKPSSGDSQPTTKPSLKLRREFVRSALAHSPDGGNLCFLILIAIPRLVHIVASEPEDLQEEQQQMDSEELANSPTRARYGKLIQFYGRVFGRESVVFRISSK